MKFIRKGQIGQGGFGKVTEIEDDNKDRWALKEFHINPHMKDLKDHARKRFIKEALYQQQINHRNVVSIKEISKDTDPPFYIMPLASSSMEADMKSGYLNEANYLSCIYDIMAGLEELHELKIYHRDLKPANVLRFGDHYAIGDFGLMSIDKTGVTTLTQKGMAKTSDFYTAPEITQDLSQSSTRSDIYSLGCILHDFVGKKNRVPCSELNEESAFGDILLGATRKDPARRFSTVSGFREVLIRVTKEQPELKTVEAEMIREILLKELEEFELSDVKRLEDFLSSNHKEEEKNFILDLITLEHIIKIKESILESKFIAKKISKYIRNNDFKFDFCDALAIRLEEFIHGSEIDVQSEAIFALLYMGVHHNRWYVERKALSYLSGEIEPKLLKRILMEISVDGQKFCAAIDHLFYSIRANVVSLNPQIQELYHKQCK